MIHRRSFRYSLATTLLAAVSIQTGCGDDSPTGADSGGAAANGGTSSKSGGTGAIIAGSSAQTGGRVGVGGVVGSGGNSATGGVAGIGGTSTVTTGGVATTTGGTATSGGAATATGGTVAATGGNAVTTGGTPAATGGTTSSGGTSVATGGSATATGGSATATGGTPATGGTVAATGGTPATGGAPPETGGTPAETGGAAVTTGGAPDATGGSTYQGSGGAAGSTMTGTGGSTVIETCTDMTKNQDETDVDCGGSLCPPCAPNKTCIQNNDCVTQLCATTCTAPQSCRAILSADVLSVDGLYWIDPDLTGPMPALQAYCDMTTDGGGWTLVYRATNRAGTIENGDVTGPAAIGTTPFTNTSTGQFKLSDDAINVLRSATVANNLRVTVRYPGFVTLLGTAFHPKECVLRTVPLGPDSPPASDVCNKSTTTSRDDTANYIQTGHPGSLTRWYVDAELGYIWPFQHIGPIPGGTNHSGNLPPTYCTWVDYRSCPEDSAFEIWAY